MKTENTFKVFSKYNSIFIIIHTHKGTTVKATHVRRCFWWSQALLSSPLFFLFFSTLSSLRCLQFFFLSFDGLKRLFFFFLITEPIWSSLQFFLSFFFSFFFLFFITEPIWSSPPVVTVEIITGPIVATSVRRLCKSNRRCINSGFVQVQSSLHQF